MSENLVIVESPAKAKKIQSYLGDGFVVKSSYGHVRDLPEKNISIDIEDGFKPRYVIPAKQKNLVAELKKLSDKAATVWLASDEDREGEAIAWHLSDVLGIPDEKIRRIVFHEITKPAILAAVEAPRAIDMNLVAAQQARRVMDRLVGFELSPVLWKKIQPKLSAGRVQSVALRLIVDREREIEAFGSEQYYRIEAVFTPAGGGPAMKGVLDSRFTSLEQARTFLEQSIGASYKVAQVTAKEGMRNPAAPFTTSTLQQEAARRLGMSVSRTMQIAQKLYEEGLITYMRTDSVNLSSLALGTAKKFICDNFGEEYSRPCHYKTSSKGAQEAHEAIRPTYVQNPDIKGTAEERKLYQLIWKRTVASQMAPAKVLGTTVEVVSDKVDGKFIISGSQVLFDGFLKLYMDNDENAEETQVLPVMNSGDAMSCSVINAECKFTQAPSRYNQQTLVKKLEELGLGRPSTYASIISTLVKARGYVVEGDKEGKEVTVTNLSLKGNSVKVSTKTEKLGAEKKRLLPQDIGIMVSDYLVENFADVMDYGFTADVEKDFDEIAEGHKKWVDVLSTFYNPFHVEVRNALENTGYSRLERQIGIDPSDGLMITARYGQFGPYVTKGEGDAKVSASLPKGRIIESLTLEDAVKLFALPRTLGQKNGEDVVILTGPYGPYMKYGRTNIRLPRGVDPYSMTFEQACALIDKSAVSAPKVIAQWGNVQILEGSYGPYIKADGQNYKIPKGTDPYSLKEGDALEIVKNSDPTSKGRRQFKKK